MFSSSDIGKAVSNEQVAVPLLHLGDGDGAYAGYGGGGDGDKVPLLHLLEEQVDGLGHAVGKVSLLGACVAPPSTAMVVKKDKMDKSLKPDLCENQVTKNW